MHRTDNLIGEMSMLHVRVCYVTVDPRDNTHHRPTHRQTRINYHLNTSRHVNFPLFKYKLPN